MLHGDKGRGSKSLERKGNRCCILPPHTIGDGFQVSCGSVNIPVSLREIRPGRALIERYGPDILLPDLREELDQCERAR